MEKADKDCILTDVKIIFMNIFKILILVVIILVAGAVIVVTSVNQKVAVAPVATILPGITISPDVCCPTPKPPPPQCECYFSSDCSEKQYCDRTEGSCNKWNKEGKLQDGMCKANRSNIDWKQVEIGLVVNAVDAWMNAYLVAGEKGDAPLVAPIQSINLPMVWHVEIATVVFNTMERLLGFDFHQLAPCGSLDSAVFQCPPSVPRLDAAGKQLVQSVGKAVVEAVRVNNPALVEKPVNDFWEQYPNFKPMHTGVCYPHGHPQVQKGGERACQTRELEQILKVFLTGR